jgi:cytochrome b
MLGTGASAEAGIDTEIAALWDFVVRASGVCLFLLLVVAYATGEEVQHTHMLIGYAIAALLIIGLWWELFRPHQSRYLDSIFHLTKVRALFQHAARKVAHTNKIASGLFVLAVVITVAVIALFALILMFLTHNFYPATNIDEMHEVVAYFALGLVAFHVVVVIVASAEHLDRSKDEPLAK